MGETRWGPGNVAIRTGIDHVQVSGTPADNKVLTATSSTEADWEDVAAIGVTEIDGGSP